MTAVGILHPGEMGAAVGALLADGWWAPDGRSAETATRAREAGLREASLPELLERCAVVLSICPPHAALDVARAAAGFRGLYCDANAVSPATALEVARIVEEGGATFVDGGIVGGPPREAGTRLYLSGREAPAVAALFAGTGRLDCLIDERARAGDLRARLGELLVVRRCGRRGGDGDAGEEQQHEWEAAHPVSSPAAASAPGRGRSSSPR